MQRGSPEVSIKLSEKKIFFLTSDATDAGDQERTGEMRSRRGVAFVQTI